LCPETYQWVPLAQCLPLLDKQKYCRLFQDSPSQSNTTTSANTPQTESQTHKTENEIQRTLHEILLQIDDKQIVNFNVCDLFFSHFVCLLLFLKFVNYVLNEKKKLIFFVSLFVGFVSKVSELREIDFRKFYSFRWNSVCEEFCLSLSITKFTPLQKSNSISFVKSTNCTDLTHTLSHTHTHTHILWKFSDLCSG
jgi:hypothetical protein